MTIPIIGAPTVLDYAVSLTFKCSCGHVFLLSGQVGTVRPCTGPGCKKIYQLRNLPVMDALGSIDVGLGVMEAQ